MRARDRTEPMKPRKFVDRFALWLRVRAYYAIPIRIVWKRKAIPGVQRWAMDQADDWLENRQRGEVPKDENDG